MFSGNQTRSSQLRSIRPNKGEHKVCVTQGFLMCSDDYIGGKGTGLGLALVRQIVKLSGGRLGVQSRVGQGSMFWVELRELTRLEIS